MRIGRNGTTLLYSTLSPIKTNTWKKPETFIASS
jgi:hypothetical protein